MPPAVGPDQGQNFARQRPTGQKQNAPSLLAARVKTLFAQNHIIGQNWAADGDVGYQATAP